MQKCLLFDKVMQLLIYMCTAIDCSKNTGYIVQFEYEIISKP